ncbi:MAG: helix-turn-helix transcriptional regulator [Clostridia bacterium]|nr:helix-turn-helix transcriptional regulator [Clostridia bacterium]
MIADRIRTLREKRGLTQAGLARLMGITRSSVNAWEMGISSPSSQYIVVLANIFNVSTDYLLGVDTSATVSVKGLTDGDISVVHSMIEHLKSKNHDNAKN